MFQIPDGLAEYWTRKAKPRATAAELSTLAEFFEGGLPAPYAEFIQSFGYVVFSMDYPDSFDASFSEGPQSVVRQGSVAYLMNAEHIATAHGLSTRDAPGEGLPAFPSSFLPIAGDAGRSLILLERTPSPGRVWYWPERDEPWGEIGNTSLGLVAEDFYGFINGLREYEDE